MKSVFLALVVVLGLSACDMRGEKGDPGLRGDTGAQGPVGETGPQGPQGPAGVDGTNGTSCSVESILGGSRITCGDSVQDVLNGTNGVDGTNGTDGTVITPIELCPTVTGGDFVEYLLRIGSNVYGVYAKGQKIGYTKLRPGNWTTTDGRVCNFTVHADNSVTY